MGLKIRNKLWLISDTHFGHKNIVKFQERPETHEVLMLSHWIDCVAEDDQILHLGDVFMGSKGNAPRWAKVLARMPGEKFVMLGNHDPRGDDKIWGIAGFEIVSPFIHDRVAFTHEPIGTKWSPGGFHLDDWDVNIHGHVHKGVFGSKDPKYDGVPLEGKGYINLCVEDTELAPVRLGNLLPRIEKLKVEA